MVLVLVETSAIVLAQRILNPNMTKVKKASRLKGLRSLAGCVLLFLIFPLLMLRMTTSWSLVTLNMSV